MPSRFAPVVCTMLLCAGAHAQQSPNPSLTTVAVLELRAVGLDQRTADALLDVVTEEVGNVPNTRALSRKEITSLVTEEMRKQLAGCTDSSCLAELGDALDAQHLLTGEMARVGDATLVTLQLINHRYATVMNRVSLSWPGPRDDLPRVTRVATQMLMLPREQKKAASLEVVDMPSGASLHVDETAVVGNKVSHLDMGVHLVRLSASGHDERTVPVLVGNGEQVKISGTLRSIPLFRRPLFWVGSAAAVGAVTVVVAVVVGVIPLTLLLFATGNARVQARQQAPQLAGW